MAILFNEIVFGPVKSRRFGLSLGMNLLPVSYKYCTFNCIYCECGWTDKKNLDKEKLPTRKEVSNALHKWLLQYKDQKIIPDNITFAGNGEPTIHPEFKGIIDDTIMLRDQYIPGTQISVLSNASLIHTKPVFDALNKVDNNVLKLDTAIESTFMALNQPAPGIKLQTIIERLKEFRGNLIVQTLFIRGKYNDQIIDNTTPKEVDAWLEALQQIRPKYVMIYPVERATPVYGLEKIKREELDLISLKVNRIGVITKVYE